VKINLIIIEITLTILKILENRGNNRGDCRNCKNNSDNRGNNPDNCENNHDNRGNYRRLIASALMPGIGMADRATWYSNFSLKNVKIIV
jgi:hypothetical protein